MPKDSTKAVSNILLGAQWHDSIEARVRTEIRGFIESMLEAELSTALGRARYARARAPEHRRAISSGPRAAALSSIRWPGRWAGGAAQPWMRAPSGS